MILPYYTNCISVYIHWPFCYTKCGYCDFNSFSLESSAQLQPNSYTFWKQAYINSLNKNKHILTGKLVHSVFFGGGTPSLMPVQLVADIIDYLNKHNRLINPDYIIQEITLESNPSSFEVGKFNDLKQAGVNRLSTGVQSFNADNLKFLGRNHNVNEALVALEESNKIFSRTSFDLIMGLPNQTLQQWHKDLSTAITYFTEHLSLYQLTIEEGTAFFRQNIKPATEEVSEAMFLHTVDFLEKHGIQQYEISNFALPNKHSIHNVNYWIGGEYLGIGPGAHSRVFTNNTWYANVEHKNPKQWYNLACNMQASNLTSSVAVNNAERLQEVLLTSLRVNLPILDIILNNIKPSVVQNLIDLNLLHKQSNNIYTTKQGKLVLNYVIEQLNSGWLI